MTSFDEHARLVASLYPARAAHYYVRAKLRMDPVNRTLCELGASEHFGTVADIGCGRGQLGLLFLVARVADAVVGVDCDEPKIVVAIEAARELPAARFEVGDVLTYPIAPADTVLLVDVLHYLPPAEQDALLVRAARAARKRVLVRDLDPQRGASSVFARGWEWAATSLGYNFAAGALHPRPPETIAATLESEGFVLTRETCSARSLSNVLLTARRP